jgi:hypothetical protein
VIFYALGGVSSLVSLSLKLLLLAPPVVTRHGAHVQNPNEPTQLGGTCALGLFLTPTIHGFHIYTSKVRGGRDHIVVLTADQQGDKKEVGYGMEMDLYKP